MTRILIICTYFPPDTAIAAVRPYMFSKYLTKMGYQVTVLRSGEIGGKADETYSTDEICYQIISYLGHDSPAEKYKRGEKLEYAPGQSRISFLPQKLRKVIGKVYHRVFRFNDKKAENSLVNAKFNKMKSVLYAMKMEGQSFDVVFSTFGNFENTLGGEYASRLFDCKYILDFRDLIAQREFMSPIEYRQMRKLQIRAVSLADVCTFASASSAKEVQNQIPDKPCYTLYNGYEPLSLSSMDIVENDKLTFCYAGQLYAGKRDASVLFNVLSDLMHEGKVELSRIVFFYAGGDFEQLEEQASAFGMCSVLKNVGYIGRKEVAELQSTSDVFIVLSWNTRKSKGILTGKLYEGIRSHKPILSIVSGKVPNSELKELADKYNYGFCYENANRETDYMKLKQWILDAYEAKMHGYEVPSTMTQSFIDDFRYDNLSKQLARIIENLTKI